MIASYEVGAVFRIINEASPEIARLIEQVIELDDLTKGAREQLTALGRPFGQGALASLRDIQAQFGLIEKDSGAARDKILYDLDQIEAVAKASGASIGLLAGSFADITKGADEASAGAIAALGRIDTAASEAGKALAGSFDAASADAVAAMSRVDKAVLDSSAALKALRNETIALPAWAANVLPGEPSLRRSIRNGPGGGGAGRGGDHGPTIGGSLSPSGFEPHARMHSGNDGFWELALGYLGGEAVKKVVEAGGDLLSEQQKLRGMGGISEEQIKRATELAQADTKTIIGTTIAENLKGIREMIGVMPTLGAAEESYPLVMRAAKVLASYTGTAADESLQTIAKAIELRGGGINPQTHQLDPDRFITEAGAFIKAIVASGGFANAPKMLQLMQQAGPMARMVDNPDTFYQGMLTAVMDMTGNRAGTALTAIGRQLLGGKMTAPTAEEMERMGLLKPGMWHKAGTGVTVNPGGLVGEDEIKDPARGLAGWMKDVLQPAFREHGYESSADVMQEMIKVFGTSTAQRLGSLYVQNEEQIKRDAMLYQNVNPDLSYQGVVGQDWEANTKNVADAFTSFAQAFGAPEVPKVIGAMQGLAGAMNDMAAAAVKHPTAAGIGVDLTALTALTTFSAGMFGIAKSWLGVGPGAGGFLNFVGRMAGAPFVAAGLAGAASPDEQKMLDKMIADEKAGRPDPTSSSGFFERLFGHGSAHKTNAIDLNPLGLSSYSADLMRYGGDNESVAGRATVGPQFIPDAFQDLTAAVKRSAAALDSWWPQFGEQAKADIALRNSGYTGQILSDEMLRESARGRALSDLPADVAKGVRTGALDGEPAVRTAMTDGTAAGVLAGLISASAGAKSIVSTWFAGVAPGGSGDLIQKASYDIPDGSSALAAAGYKMSGGRYSAPVPSAGPGAGGVSPQTFLSALDAGQRNDVLDAMQKVEGWQPGNSSYVNNNPGNINWGAWAAAHGAIGHRGRFATFPDYATGRAAQEALVFGTYGKKTIEEMLNLYAPPSDGNDPTSYARQVARAIRPPRPLTIPMDGSLARAHRAAERNSPSAPAPAGQMVEDVHVHNIHLDGRLIASVVSKHQKDATTFPRKGPVHDTRKYYSPPDIGYQVG